MKQLLCTCALAVAALALTACQEHGQHSATTTSNTAHIAANPSAAADRFDGASVIEIASFKLADGITYDDFAKLDAKVEEQHVSKQPGFVYRDSAKGDNGEWLVVVYWKDIASAEASMASFGDVPAAADFMKNLNVQTMQMKRYRIVP